MQRTHAFVVLLTTLAALPGVWAAKLTAACAGTTVWWQASMNDDVDLLQDDTNDRFTQVLLKSGNRGCKGVSAKGAEPLKLAEPRIDFEGGTPTERDARLVPDPAQPARKVLAFSLQQAYAKGWSGKPAKGRVQMDVYGNQGIRQLRVRVRVKLPADMAVLRDFPGRIDWLTVSEWWNNASWSNEPLPFRITVNLTKPQAGRGSALRLQAHAQSLGTAGRWDKTWWEQTNDAFEFPVGRWVTLEYWLVEGDSRSGRFQLTATVEGQKPLTVLDVSGPTHDPSDPKPNGWGHFNPLKLYTSKQVIEYAHRNIRALQIMWMDLHILGCSELIDCH
ncbi:MAG: hypothetical protein J0M20_01105 [Burkholderiales bacterium]|nr:hypothetical protein [Burkholderiales bacterium]